MLVIKSFAGLVRRMGQHHRVNRLVALWAVWGLALFVFQLIVPGRFQLNKPDQLFDWGAGHTGAGWEQRHPLLAGPFLNSHVAWDSEFYLALATDGYTSANIPVDPKTGLSKTYAWLPMYGWTMGLLAAPLHALGMNPLAAATLAGVVISMLGTLFGLLALYDLARLHIGDEGAWRAAQYFLIFPTSFFLAQVYTEGLFMALSFGCLALAQRRQYVGAGILAALAMWTRPVGVALALPLAYGLFAEWRIWMGLTHEPGRSKWGIIVQPFLTNSATSMQMPTQMPMPNMMWMTTQTAGQAGPQQAASIGASTAPLRYAQRRLLGNAVLGAVVFLAAVLALRFSEIGASFLTVQMNVYSAEPLALVRALHRWGRLVLEMVSGSPALALNSGLVLACTALGALACLHTARRAWVLALYSALVLVIPMSSGFPPNSMTRYVLAAPAVFLFLGYVGRRAWVDANWRFISTLLLGLLMTLWTFDFWAG